MELRRSSVREVVLKQAERAAALVDRGDWETIDGSENQRSNRSGERWLTVESDGSMVRTGELERDQEGGVSPQMGRPKLRRRTRWREVRLSVAEALGGTERQYGRSIGFSPKGGRADVCLGAAVRPRGEYPGAWCGDGAPWIAQQMAAVFPRQSFLLDRYHLLEHLREGASLLVEGAKTGPRLEREAWVNEQVSRIDQGRASPGIRGGG